MPDLPTSPNRAFRVSRPSPGSGCWRRPERRRRSSSKLYQEAVKVAAQPDMREKFAQIGVDSVGNPPDEFAAIIKADTAKWAKVIRDAGIKASE